MGSTSYTRPAVETVVDGKTITKRTSLKKDISGNLVTFEEFVEDENSTVTNRVVSSTVFTTTVQTITVTGSDLVVEDLSAQLVDESAGPYSLTTAAKENTLSVYLNGVMINEEITLSGNSAFLISDSYKRVVEASGSLFAIYSKDT